MSSTMLSRLVACTLSGAILVVANQACAQSKVPARFAVKEAIGPSDAPVRDAIYTQTDRQNVKVQPVHWGYRGGYYAPYRAKTPASLRTIGR